MSYRLYATKRNPIALWNLDDTAPFQEHAGTGYAADVLAGSTAPTKAAPLVYGAEWSSVFDNTHQARYTCPVFQQGREKRTFAIESWIYPINRSVGETAERKNYIFDTSTNDGTLSPWISYGTGTVAESVVVDGRRAIRLTKSAAGLSMGISTTGLTPRPAGQQVTASAWVKNPVGSALTGYRFFLRDDTNNHTWGTSALIPVAADGLWYRVSYTATVPASRTLQRFYITKGTADTVQVGEEGFVRDVMLNDGTLANFFDGDTSGAKWDGTAYDSSSTMLLSNSPVQILSNLNRYDGLTISGNIVKFRTEYTTAVASECTYDLGFPRAAHVVGLHTADANQLWVNGELVAQVELTETQKADQFAADDAFLYSGLTTSSAGVAMNGAAIYRTISAEGIKANYAAGIDVTPQSKVYTMYGGTALSMAGDRANVFETFAWDSIEEFSRAKISNVTVTPEAVLPSYENGVSVPGTWTTSWQMDYPATSIYGVMVEWSGEHITIEGSLDEVTWTPLTNRRLIPFIPEGFDPTGKELLIRVTFAGGQATDPAYLESLKVIGFLNNQFEPVQNLTITASHPSVLRGDFEPIEYREDNGVYLAGGTATITKGVDDPQDTRTVEIWVKPVTGSVTFGPAATAQYRNGEVSTSLPVGEWSLVHLTYAANVTAPITITGDCVVGQVVLYPTQLTATDILTVYKAYTGRPTYRVLDTGTIGVTEPTTPALVYTAPWSIEGAG